MVCPNHSKSLNSSESIMILHMLNEDREKRSNEENKNTKHNTKSNQPTANINDVFGNAFALIVSGYVSVS